MLSAVAADLSFKIDFKSWSVNPYPQQEAEAAFQAQHVRCHRVTACLLDHVSVADF